MQEFILIKRIGAFRLLSKNTYTEMPLGRIEREHGDVVYWMLEEKRRNNCVRCNVGNDKDDREFQCMTVDETMELINHWDKKLTLINKVDNCMQHSRNVMIAIKCINFVNQQCKRGHLVYDDEKKMLKKMEAKIIT